MKVRRCYGLECHCVRSRRLDRLSGEGGQVVALTAITLAVMVGAAALSIDVGSLDSVKARLQGVAEAAAIAGARDLPASPTNADVVKAEADALTLVNTNLAGSNLTGVTAAYKTPFNGKSTQIEVTVTANSPSLFAGVFGIVSSKVSAKAAANNTQTFAQKYALFSGDTSCGKGGINVSGSGMNVSGATHSNGSYTISGSNNSFGLSDAGCTPTETGTNNMFGSSSIPGAGANNLPYPETYNQATVCSQPGVHTGTSIDVSSGTPSGIYCYSTKIKISTSNVSATVTLVAPDIQLRGSNLTLTPAYKDLLAYNTNTTVGNNSLNLSGSGNVFTGTTIYDPYGRLKISGSNIASFDGFFEADTITLPGSALAITGEGPVVGANANNVVATE